MILSLQLPLLNTSALSVSICTLVLLFVLSIVEFFHAIEKKTAFLHDTFIHFCYVSPTIHTTIKTQLILWSRHLSGPQSQQNPHPNKQSLHTSKVSGGPRFFRCNHPESETSGCCAGKAESQSTNQHSLYPQQQSYNFSFSPPTLFKSISHRVPDNTNSG